MAVHIHRPRPIKGRRKMAKIRNGKTVSNNASRIFLANPYRLTDHAYLDVSPKNTNKPMRADQSLIENFPFAFPKQTHQTPAHGGSKINISNHTTLRCAQTKNDISAANISRIADAREQRYLVVRSSPPIKFFSVLSDKVRRRVIRKKHRCGTS